jgi:hypothetical protein
MVSAIVIEKGVSTGPYDFTNIRNSWNAKTTSSGHISEAGRSTSVPIKERERSKSTRKTKSF